jgi:hypothetical protein
VVVVFSLEAVACSLVAVVCSLGAAALSLENVVVCAAALFDELCVELSFEG